MNPKDFLGAQNVDPESDQGDDAKIPGAPASSSPELSELLSELLSGTGMTGLPGRQAGEPGEIGHEKKPKLRSIAAIDKPKPVGSDQKPKHSGGAAGPKPARGSTKPRSGGSSGRRKVPSG